MTKNHNLHFIPSIMWSLCLEKSIQSKELPAEVALLQEPSVLQKWNPAMAFPFSKQLCMYEKKQKSKSGGWGTGDFQNILLQAFTFIKHSKPCCN